MKITYLSHSGFMIELRNKVLVFDYSDKELKIPAKKDVYFFVSHGHKDHFNTMIFSACKKAKFIVEQGVSVSGIRDVVIVEANQSIAVDEIKIQTLKSNDEGVAFLVHVDGKCFYHAGDLNWWHWLPEENEQDIQENLQMEVSYKKELEKLADANIDVAFVVVDPRLKEATTWGINAFKQVCKAKEVVAMHMWEKNELVWEKLIKEEIACIVPSKNNQVIYEKESV